MKLCLGSGAGGVGALAMVDPDPRDWKLIDICPDWNPTECYDISGGIREADSSIDRIWMGDFLEHVLRARAPFVLKECCRVLKPGAELLVMVPDMALVMPRWLETQGREEYELIWGQQGEHLGKNELPDSHYNGFTEKTLRTALATAGFGSVSKTRVHGVWYELALSARKP